MARLAFFLFVLAAAISVTPVDGQEVADKRPTKIWNLTGPLGETPKRVTDAYPLSDQDNKGGVDQVRADERRIRGPGTRSQQVESWHVLVERSPARSVQRQERHGLGREAAPDDAEGASA